MIVKPFHADNSNAPMDISMQRCVVSETNVESQQHPRLAKRRMTLMQDVNRRSELEVDVLYCVFKDRSVEEAFQLYLYPFRLHVAKKALYFTSIPFVLFAVFIPSYEKPFATTSYFVTTAFLPLWLLWCLWEERRLKKQENVTDIVSMERFQIQNKRNYKIFSYIAVFVYLIFFLLNISGRVDFDYKGTPMTLIMLCWGFPVLSSLPISWVFWIENILMGITTGCDLFVINSIKYVYYVPSLAVTMFTGGFLLHNIAIDQRIIFRGFLKKSDAPIGQPKWLVECAEQNANLRKLTMDQQHFFRFKDRAFQEEFQAYIEDRSLLYVRLSLFMLAMTNIVMPLRIPFFPKVCCMVNEKIGCFFWSAFLHDFLSTFVVDGYD
eukprot:TRINITY_DN3660_c0_g1_i1.p1 TRINITY_DN3660_c0_g1~~TRINITY_DN3660_c0_g1_i1.p1  ORF type:complete len:379 (+),score=60.34 TRINITY_DN3660_c0_g1_i1:43-1179(+)